VPTRFPRSTNVFTRLTIVEEVKNGKTELRRRRRRRRRRELCSLLSWEISRKEHLCARFFASPRILRHRRAINHKSVTARGKLLESLFPASLPPRPSAGVPFVRGTLRPLPLPPSARKRPRPHPRPLLPHFNRYCRDVTVTALPFPRGGGKEGGEGSGPLWGPRDNPEFCITTVIRTTRRVPHSPTLRCRLLLLLFLLCRPFATCPPPPLFHRTSLLLRPS